jgi:hypothetical protein
MKRNVVMSILIALLAVLMVVSPVLASTQSVTDNLKGIEISVGFKLGNTRIGATFVSLATGDLPGTLRASINYTPNEPLVGPPAGVNTITGGSWSLNVIKNGRFAGFVEGKICGGTVDWGIVQNQAHIVMTNTLTVTRVCGQGLCLQKGDTGSFDGWLSHDAFPPSIMGTLTFNGIS